ncbi:hypothetical protein QJS10_CPB21g01038 [Acorus calamus]|uniref:Uncharacterized protein n=1 Tax=Acorus calamus TaxID=4465 RepID=A0AAV9C4F2_ACOCL|nr:hypothetical protein QJS10_CPB21g01038 [Acorus calamus]
MIDMYAKCFHAIATRRMFDEMLDTELYDCRDVEFNMACWTVMINGNDLQSNLSFIFQEASSTTVAQDSCRPCNV